MYRVYWANNYENIIDYIDVSTLFTAKLIFYKLLISNFFYNSLEVYGGIKVYLDYQWFEWVDKNKKTIWELFESDGSEI